MILLLNVTLLEGYIIAEFVIKIPSQNQDETSEKCFQQRSFNPQGHIWQCLETSNCHRWVCAVVI